MKASLTMQGVSVIAGLAVALAATIDEKSVVSSDCIMHPKESCSYLNYYGLGNRCDETLTPLPATKEVPSDTLIDGALSKRCVFEYEKDKKFCYCTPVPGGLAMDEMSQVLRHLKATLDQEIPGAIVEMGVFEGVTSSFIQQQLILRNKTREFHVYDSFEGLPNSTKDDGNHTFGAGTYASPMTKLIENMASVGVPNPVIHKGWFAKIPDHEYPTEIAFAFLDSDLYEPLYDSIVRVWPRMAPGGRIVMHDVGTKRWKGARKAMEDFLESLDGPTGSTTRSHRSLLESAWPPNACPCSLGLIVKPSMASSPHAERSDL